MEYISEDKICYAIEQCLNVGKDRFIIYPYGKKGKWVKEILHEQYKIKELAIVDNGLSKSEKNIYSSEEADKLFKDCTILFSAEKEEIRENLKKTTLYVNNQENVIDILDVKMPKRMGYSGRKKMQIDSCNAEQLKNIFARTHEIWTKLGEEDSYWSVLSDNRFRSEHIGKKEIENFYETGKENTEQIVATLIRNEWVEEASELKNYTITEIGCGCGRVTKSLADLFRHVNAVDISRGNLVIAGEMVPNGNVTFRLIAKVDEYGKLSKTDVAYSYLVLQHNCPPIIEYMIDAMLKMLNEGGIAIFQVPTYERGYQFHYDEYMQSEKKGMEMHLLPQQKIFEIAYRNQCIPLEVYLDDSTGKDDHSMWFVMKKTGNKEK
ncbi:MAG: class I SAM-dependent methyltransferase [Roseburia sp.]|nr:class I SAM-dependent methyltransferase [Roseburia sp.]